MHYQSFGRSRKQNRLDCQVTSFAVGKIKHAIIDAATSGNIEFINPLTFQSTEACFIVVDVFAVFQACCKSMNEESRLPITV